MIEKVAFPTFVETKEYSARVTGKTIYTGPSMVVTEGSGTTWLPEVFGESVARLIKGLPVEELEVIEEKIQQAISEGHQYWLLTTYTTLTNYQHSLGAIPFSALVFDETMLP